MKKQGLALLFALTGICFGLCLGFFVGRNLPEEVPEIGIIQLSAPEETEPAAPGLININTADAALLTMLPGIGEVTADRIIAHRTEYGPFQSCEELLNVSGIGEKTLSQILPYITTGG